MNDDEPSLNIPSLLTLAVVSYFVFRWFFNRDEGSNGGGRPRRVDPAQVEQISQMFPQLSTREIMWDLQRNGGSPTATTERILSGQGLETPPPSFQPQTAIPTAQAPAARAAAAVAAAAKFGGQDLITRYNLGGKVTDESADDSQSPISKNAWSQNKDERQRLLQKRRDDMILAARKKMMDKKQSPAQ
ncbi:hypothetical protein N7478_008329 [Penicillium angulare]|uniref:uncharacterized protein n=1 Tax=Penicillium angulare TaxID=116970 RepID=UPI00254249D5|nr:uncharacterized protein N7478_008329 [Penicillium angulare]KAJ5273204.1 hypothetical protein N7478_008329 [Penicillium angulare]